MLHLPGRFGRPNFVPTRSTLHDPVSDIIGLTALINSAITSVVGFGTVGTIAGISATTIGGALVGVPMSRLISVVMAR
jgi:hypothetical protein